MVYTIEQFRDYCKDLDKTTAIKCPICDKLYSYKGLWTHIDRSHNGNKKYSQGNNGCYHKLEYKQAISKGVNKYNNTVLGEFKEFEVVCHKCGKKFIVVEREKQFPQKDKYFCCEKCSHSHTQTEEQNLSRSLKLKGKYFKPRVNTKERICKQCGKTFINRKRHFCSDECLKNWKRRNQIGLKKYRTECQFTFALNQYPEEFDFTLIEKYGWYKASNHGDNLNGISRDHMYSVYDGFINNIDPKIISHPANCELMQHNKNSSKYKKSSITLEELLERIEKWNKKYGEIV